MAAPPPPACARSAHLEGKGLASAALSYAGLPKGTEEDIRRRLADTPDRQQGMELDKLLGQAAFAVTELGHDYVGTEHQLLVIASDDLLSPAVLAVEARRAASAHVRQRLSELPTR